MAITKLPGFQTCPQCHSLVESETLSMCCDRYYCYYCIDGHSEDAHVDEREREYDLTGQMIEED